MIRGMLAPDYSIEKEFPDYFPKLRQSTTSPKMPFTCAEYCSPLEHAKLRLSEACWLALAAEKEDFVICL
jgi:hypothetical protein